MKTLMIWGQKLTPPPKLDDVDVITTVEDLCYIIEYSNGLEHYDKFVVDVSLPAGRIVHKDGLIENYYQAYNGIDIIGRNLEKWRLDKSKVAFIGGDYPIVKQYLDMYPNLKDVTAIDSLDYKDYQKFQGFLEQKSYTRTK